MPLLNTHSFLWEYLAWASTEPILPSYLWKTEVRGTMLKNLNLVRTDAAIRYFVLKLSLLSKYDKNTDPILSTPISYVFLVWGLLKLLCVLWLVVRLNTCSSFFWLSLVAILCWCMTPVVLWFSTVADLCYLYYWSMRIWMIHMWLTHILHRWVRSVVWQRGL